MPVLEEGKTLQTHQYPALFKKLMKSLLSIFQGEQKRVKDSGAEVVRQLMDEFVLYAYNKDPFRSHLWTRTTKPLKWWQKISEDSNAKLLAASFFSILLSDNHYLIIKILESGY
jgi:hypothetical protein